MSYRRRLKLAYQIMRYGEVRVGLPQQYTAAETEAQYMLNLTNSASGSAYHWKYDAP